MIVFFLAIVCFEICFVAFLFSVKWKKSYDSQIFIVGILPELDAKRNRKETFFYKRFLYF